MHNHQLTVHDHAAIALAEALQSDLVTVPEIIDTKITTEYVLFTYEGEYPDDDLNQDDNRFVITIA